jgi:fumarylacetoacetate (FAA) hydrolase
MKLGRLDVDGSSVIALIDGDQAVPVAEGGQFDLVAIAGSGEAPPAIGSPIPLQSARLLAPISQPPSLRDFFAFEAHVKNSRAGAGLEVDPGWYERPLFYFSNPAAIFGPDDEILPPRGTRTLDYELEVACVIGKEASDLDPDDPATLDVIVGYTILNDWSARDIQVKEMAQNLGPAKGKDFATSIGPWLVTPDEMPNAATGRPKAHMAARVNGEQWSDGEMGDIHFSWTELLAYASANTRLVPGDVIGSGTCGTGCILELRSTGFRDTRHWLKEGDVVELDVEGIGVLRNHIGARP